MCSEEGEAMTTLGIVVPCYNEEEEVLPEITRRLLALLELLIEKRKIDRASRIPEKRCHGAKL